jgi:hypothetical protein
MFQFILFILFSQVNSFLILPKKNFITKTIINVLPEYYHIQSNSVIISYDLSSENKNNIQNEINDKSFNKFTIYTDNIYVSLFDYTKDDPTKIISAFQIFVYVHDILNDSKGQYILESKDYIKKESKSIICSYYEFTNNYQINFSCCQFNYDNMNYHSNYDNMNYHNNYIFEFIYDNGKYFKNMNTNNYKVNYTPRFIYASIFKYKDMFWEKSNNIIYHKVHFTFKLKK